LLLHHFTNSSSLFCKNICIISIFNFMKYFQVVSVEKMLLSIFYLSCHLGSFGKLSLTFAPKKEKLILNLASIQYFLIIWLYNVSSNQNMLLVKLQTHCQRQHKNITEFQRYMFLWNLVSLSCKSDAIINLTKKTFLL
jgi:hypothetical protein